MMGTDDIMLPDYVAEIRRIVAESPGRRHHPARRRGHRRRRHASPASLADQAKDRVYLPKFAGTKVLGGEELAASLLRGCWFYFPSLCWRSDAVTRRQLPRRPAHHPGPGAGHRPDPARRAHGAVGQGGLPVPAPRGQLQRRRGRGREALRRGPAVLRRRGAADGRAGLAARGESGAALHLLAPARGDADARPRSRPAPARGCATWRGTPSCPLPAWGRSDGGGGVPDPAARRPGTARPVRRCVRPRRASRARRRPRRHRLRRPRRQRGAAGPRPPGPGHRAHAARHRARRRVRPDGPLARRHRRARRRAGAASARRPSSTPPAACGA